MTISVAKIRWHKKTQTQKVTQLNAAKRSTTMKPAMKAPAWWKHSSAIRFAHCLQSARDLAVLETSAHLITSRLTACTASGSGFGGSTELEFMDWLDWEYCRRKTHNTTVLGNENDLSTISPINVLSKYADDTNLIVPQYRDVDLTAEFHNIQDCRAMHNKMTINLKRPKRLCFGGLVHCGII